ncbi:MAG: UvrD-helicase domain-containing protein [Candidatus Palauibacterales bacterium]|nr:UvrD-helicase domain-containing protein [Candidatus Palauibacterales bacterium]
MTDADAGGTVTLNPEQREAVEHGDGPLLVLAGAGSGKTRVLTVRAARLIEEEGIPPERLLAVTFTNKAASEMRERIAGLLGQRPRGMWTGTFHSVAARLLRREAEHLDRDHNFTIYDQDDSLRAVKRAMEEVDLNPKRWSPKSIRSRISNAKNAMVGPSDFEEKSFDLVSRRVADVYPEYERHLRRSNAYDFDDLLVEAVRLLEDRHAVREHYAGRFLHVLVDEYQDTNHAQYRMVRALAEEHGNVCVVGDDDQSIYGWRGADLSNILDFERDFPGAHVVRLERNYRSTRPILDVANAVIAENEERKPKELRETRGDGEPVQVVRVPDEKAEAAWTVRRIEELTATGQVEPRDCAVLYRTNAQSRPYENALRRAGVPYRIVGGVRFYERREIKDVLAYLQLAVNPADEAAFRRAAQWPKRGVGDVTLERLTEAARDAGETVIAAAARATEIDAVPTRGAKSLEEFAEGVRALGEMQDEEPVDEVIRDCIQRFGLLAALAEEEDGDDRLDNVTELVADASDFDRSEVEEAEEDASDLEVYLQTVRLLTDRDRYEDEADGVTLMTLHNAKGLEFPVVFVGGVEEDLFPLSRSADDPAGLEEERRLFYVGVTRAEDRLFLTHADRRWRFGSESPASPSRFLDELPPEPVDRRVAAGASSPDEGSTSSAGRPTGSTSSAAAAGSSGSGEFSWHQGPGSGNGSSGENPGEDGTGGGSSAGDDGSGAGVGVRYDYDDSQVPLELEVGGRVVHPRFGPGTIQSVSGSGDRTKAEIDFDDSGVKKVMVAHADLRPA